MKNALRIRDKDGNFVSIPAISGADGKSAYEYAVEGGFEGTEEEFCESLTKSVPANFSNHIVDKGNPHDVTASQVGALPITGGTLTGQSIFFDNGNARVMGGEDFVQIDVFDNPKDATNRRKIVFSGKNKTPSVKDALGFSDYTDSAETIYKLYGTHNKPTASDVGALPTSGGLVTGAIAVDKASAWGQYVIYSPEDHYRCFEADDSRVRIDVRDDKLTTDRRYLDIFSNVEDSRHTHAMRFTQSSTTNGNLTSYVLHTDNINSFVISKGSYSGSNGTSKSIPIRKTTQMVMVYATSSSGDAWMFCAMMRGMTRVHCNLAAGGEYSTNLNVTWANDKVTYGLENADPRYSLDLQYATYHYVIVG